MADTFLVVFKTLGYIFIKSLTGIIIVPLGILLQETWGWWEQTTGAKKILLGVFYVPAAGFMRVVGSWWNDF